jgi:hypothetical protein
MKEGCDVFSRLYKQFNELVDVNGYKDLSEIRGKLETI